MFILSVYGDTSFYGILNGNVCFCLIFKVYFVIFLPMAFLTGMYVENRTLKLSVLLHSATFLTGMGVNNLLIYIYSSFYAILRVYAYITFFDSFLYFFVKHA